jgi:hypothetical protein
MSGHEPPGVLPPVLTRATTRELLDELKKRMAEWPEEMRAARAVLRGTIQATYDMAEKTPGGVVHQALDSDRA